MTIFETSLAVVAVVPTSACIPDTGPAHSDPLLSFGSRDTGFALPRMSGLSVGVPRRPVQRLLARGSEQKA